MSIFYQLNYYYFSVIYF